MQKESNLNSLIRLHPAISLFVLFVLIVGIITGIVTHSRTLSADSGGYIVDAAISNIAQSLLISLFKNAMLFFSSLLCAIWIPGILSFSLTLTAEGFIAGFTACALLRYSVLQGLLYVVISQIIPLLVIFYALFIISIASISEWSLRFREYLRGKKKASLDPDYAVVVQPAIYIFALGIFVEGIVSPLIISLIL